MDTAQRIRERLGEKLAPLDIEIIDDSHLHAGHAGARSGGGHYRIRIVASAFEGLAPVARQRLVYAALSEEMSAGLIHALSMETVAPDESS